MKTSTNPPLRILDNRYELRSRLGSGGMATVYLAWDHLMSREVAIKLLRHELVADELAASRFQYEGTALARIESERVVSIYDMQMGPASWYLVLRYLAGRTLEQAVLQHGPFGPVCAARIARDVLVGVSDLHREGVIHRDVKPANVIVDAGDRATLLDLGVALGPEQKPEGRRIVGTKAVMAPEAKAGGDVDVRSDIYQVGLLLEYAITGRLRGSKATAPPPAIPAPIAQVIARATSEQPGDRYGSAMAMYTALSDATLECETIDIGTEDVELAAVTAVSAVLPKRTRRASVWSAVAFVTAAIAMLPLLQERVSAAADGAITGDLAALTLEPTPEHIELEPVFVGQVEAPAAPAAVTLTRHARRAAPPSRRSVLDTEIAPNRPITTRVPMTADDFLHMAERNDRNGAREAAIAAYRAYVRLAGDNVRSDVIARLHSIADHE